ncbi:MAG: hypothetical protein V1814_01105 [Candidatus Moraniibacteriota bacterium]
MSRMEAIEQKEVLNDGQIIQGLADGFINSIPENRPLYEKSEKGETTTRAIAFGQFFNQLLTISMGAENLNREQKESIMKRIETLKKEAFHWTKQSDSGRDFVQEVDEMAKSIWLK